MTLAKGVEAFNFFPVFKPITLLLEDPVTHVSVKF